MPSGEFNLNDLRSEDFLLKIGIATSARELRRFLLRMPEVVELRDRVKGGFISEAAVRAYLDELYLDFVRGQQFPHEIALAALAVAIEPLVSGFVDEYLTDLARLTIVEMQIAPAVARHCKSVREKLPITHQKLMSFTQPSQAVAIFYSAPAVENSETILQTADFVDGINAAA